eukprot:tig00021462_g21572.t1
MEVEVRGSKHCGLRDCNQLDFLPFVCQHCRVVFCNDHWKADAHKCTAARLDTALAVTCPICQQILHCRGQNADDLLSAHIDAGCPREASAADAARQSAPACAAPRCTTRLTGASPLSTPTACKSCRRLFCLSHRLEPDHKCGAAASSSPGPSIGPFRLSRSRRRTPRAPPPRRAPPPPPPPLFLPLPSRRGPRRRCDRRRNPRPPPPPPPCRMQFGFGGPKQAPHNRFWSNWGSGSGSGSGSGQQAPARQAAAAGQSPFSAFKASQSQQAQAQAAAGAAGAGPGEARAATIQIRLLDGKTVTQKFSSTDTLRTVRSFVASLCSQQQQRERLKLMTPFPRQTFGEELMDLTLETADLVPSGTLVATV